MQLIIDQHRAELQVLCQRFQVKTLELFGSATDGRFDPHRSDLDFLVDFLPMPRARTPRPILGCYWRWKTSSLAKSTWWSFQPCAIHTL